MSTTYSVAVAALAALMAVVILTRSNKVPKLIYEPKRLNDCFMAAVYEHQRIGDFIVDYNATRVANQNLIMYERVAQLAVKRGASLIVFPEASLHKFANRQNVNSVAEEIPDPSSPNKDNKSTKRSSNINPCSQASIYKPKSPKLTRLSCLAKQLNIYVVVNLSEMLICTSKNKDCPNDGHYNYNTDVVFDNQGNLVAKYRKFNIFNEELFNNVPEEPERIVLETPFGRLGIFTCFDIVFARPAIDLVLKDKVTTVLYPTRWYDELPFFTAIQAQSAWAYTMNVNLLAANGHLPMTGTIGSGVYAGRKGPIIYQGVKSTRDGRDYGAGSTLILANIPVDPNSDSNSVSCDSSQNAIIHVGHMFKPKKGYENEKSKKSLNDNAREILKYAHMNMAYNEGTIDKDIPLLNTQEDRSVCVEEFCCRIRYKIRDSNSIRDRSNVNGLILFVRNHVRPGKYKWYEQSCFFATIDKEANPPGKRVFSTRSPFKFDHIRLDANFDTQYVFEASANNISTLLTNSAKQFKCSNSPLEDTSSSTKQKNYCHLEIKGHEDELTTAGLYGRMYDKDQ